MLSPISMDRRLAVVYAALEAAGWDVERAREVLRSLLEAKGWPGLHAWILLAFREEYYKTVDAVKAGARPSPENLQVAREWIKRLRKK